MTETEAKTFQHWRGMNGATAYHLIERHADGWPDISVMMEAWLAANTEALKAAITGLLKFHQEGDDGAELPREYWAPGYREAVEHAEALVGPNVQIEAADAALSRQVASNAGLGLDNLKGK